MGAKRARRSKSKRVVRELGENSWVESRAGVREERATVSYGEFHRTQLPVQSSLSRQL